MTQRLTPVYPPEDPEVALLSGIPAGADATYIIGFRGATKINAFRHTATDVRSLAVQTNAARRTITIKNTGANTVYIGGEDIDTIKGYPLATGDAITLELSGELWVITEATDETVQIIGEVDV